MVYTLRFFSSKCNLFHNSSVFGSCIIHILYTGCAKIKKNNSGAKRLSKLKMICDYSDFDDNNLDITWRTLQNNFRNASYRNLCLRMEAAC